MKKSIKHKNPVIKSQQKNVRCFIDQIAFLIKILEKHLKTSTRKKCENVDVY